MERRLKIVILFSSIQEREIKRKRKREREREREREAFL
jgi:hypothetical protein